MIIASENVFDSVLIAITSKMLTDVEAGKQLEGSMVQDFLWPCLRLLETLFRRKEQFFVCFHPELNVVQVREVSDRIGNRIEFQAIQFFWTLTWCGLSGSLQTTFFAVD